MWHDVINNTTTKQPYDKRNPLATAELLSEIRTLSKKAGKNYYVREGADELHNELKTIPIPIVHVVKDVISVSKRKDKFETNGYKELQQDHTLELAYLGNPWKLL